MAATTQHNESLSSCKDKAKLFQEATKTRPLFSLPKVLIQVQNCNGELKRLVSCLKCMELRDVDSFLNPGGWQ